MKIYVLFNERNDKVIALSEDKSLVYRYVIQQNFSSEYKISKIKKDDLVNRFLIIYDDLILQDYDEFVLTSFESRIINRTVDEEKARLEDAIECLVTMVKDYNFSSGDQKVLLEAIKVLNKNKKPKRLGILICIKEFIYSIIHPQGNSIIEALREEICAKENHYIIHININDD
jgi:hypothetical protein